jgi:hypothetical protein
LHGEPPQPEALPPSPEEKSPIQERHTGHAEPISRLDLGKGRLTTPDGHPIETVRQGLRRSQQFYEMGYAAPAAKIRSVNSNVH